MRRRKLVLAILVAVVHVWVGQASLTTAQDTSGALPDPPAEGTGESDSQEPSAAEPMPSVSAALESEDPLADSFDYPLHGLLRLGLRGRWVDGEDDYDASAYLSVDGGDETRHGVTFNVTARALKDLDGGASGDDLFFDVSDTYDDSFQTLLYRAYIDIHTFDDLSLLRIGRQQDIETPRPAYYDGVHVRTRDDEDVHVGAYGGLSTHLFESTDEDDRLFGGYVGARPWDSGRLRLDYMRARDHRRTPDSADDIVSLGAWQTVGEDLNLEGFYSFFEGRGRDLRLRGNWYEPEQDLQVRASYYQLLNKQSVNALEFDEFSGTLLETFPYHQFSLSTSKGWGSAFRMSGGLDFRRLDDSSDEGQFNREFERYYLTTTFGDLLNETSSASVTVDFWDSDGREYTTVGADLVSDISDELRTSVGTYYSNYKTQILGVNEREDVRTYFVRVDYELTENWSLDMTYDFENSEIDDFHVARIDLQWRF